MELLPGWKVVDVLVEGGIKIADPGLLESRMVDSRMSVDPSFAGIHTLPMQALDLETCDTPAIILEVL